MVKLKVIHVAHSYGGLELLAGSSVYKLGFAVVRPFKLCKIYLCGVFAGKLVFMLLSIVIEVAYIFLVNAVEYGGHYLPAQSSCNVAQMHFKNLSDVHTGRNAQRVKHDIQRCAVGQEGHILLL